MSPVQFAWVRSLLGRFFLVLATIFLVSPAALAFYTVQDTGDLLDEKEYKFSAELQFITSGDDGVNVIGRFDTGFDEDSNFRFLAGVGTTDYVFGAFYKWVPYPDFEKQPAIGLTSGVQLAKYEDETEMALRFIPFISKQFETDIGTLTPYTSLPVNIRHYDGETDMPVQLILGTRYRHPEYDEVEYTAELGFEIQDAVTFISFGVMF